MLLEHTGRKSGTARFTCLEVIERPSTNRILVASGFGETSQWYRNLRANPKCFITTGRIRRRLATATLLPADESAKALARYQSEHAESWKLLKQVIEKDGATSPDDVPIVEFRLD